MLCGRDDGGCLLTERTVAGQRSTGRRRDDRYAMPRARLTTAEWRGLNAMQDNDNERKMGEKMGEAARLFDDVGSEQPWGYGRKTM